VSYYYFISSLPNIEFGQKPPFSEEEFLQQAALWMPELIKLDDQKEAEKAIDLLRWNFFDELTTAHSFDFHIALTYFLKLKILTRWAAFDKGIGKENLNKNLVI